VARLPAAGRKKKIIINKIIVRNASNDILTIKYYIQIYNLF
jgi:hypothetical protein